MSGVPPVLTFGETMGLATSSRAGSFTSATTLDLGIGGAETNVAIGLTRLGIQATWVSRLGDDGIGRLILRELRAEQVDAVVAIDSAAPTGLMLKERLPGARSTVSYYRAGSAASRLSADDLPPHLFVGRKLVHLTGITPALSESGRNATLHAAQTARRLGIPVSLDLNYRSKLWRPSQAAPVLAQLVALSTVVFAGVEEAQLLFPEVTDPIALAHCLVSAGATDAIIKLGDAGCVAMIDGEEHTVGAVPIEPVDTVGAGDAFVAGYLAQQVRGADADERLRQAVLTGALACLAPGDWEGAPHQRDLEEFGRVDAVTR